MKKEIPEDENPNEIVDFAEIILDSNKDQKGKGIKILTTKQMLQDDQQHLHKQNQVIHLNSDKLYRDLVPKK